ncbi:hypothetical protein [Nocardioides currus]|uniref:Uncharacterized protein n=1 Tax=Nocardioides currus TaxID=2133958 RepID=A0A2R7Z0R2_9ACTN|nr:hypothetical protein [Nocardioides currus]PUA82190.1 hypothetical protein C7S10_00010 [Nocardioides currus]
MTGFVPPHTVDSGSASVVLDVEDRAAWRSGASGCWLVVDNDGTQLVQAGAVIVITEGRRTVAYFHVESVDAIADAALRS